MRHVALDGMVPHEDLDVAKATVLTNRVRERPGPEVRLPD
jgi:hypothetical protein